MELSAASINDSLLSGSALNTSAYASSPKRENATRPAVLYSITRLLGFVAFTTFITWFSLHVGLLLIGDRYMYDSDNTLDVKAVIGTIWYFAGLCVAPLFISFSAFFTAQHRVISRILRVSLLCYHAALCFLIMILSFSYLAQADITFRQSPHPDNYKQFLGGFLIILFSILGFGITAIAFNAWREAPAGHNPHAASREVQKDIQPYAWRYRWKGIVLFYALFGFCMFLTSFMSPVWNYSATSYFQATSPYSLVDAVWNIDINYNDTNVNPNNVWLPQVIVVKLYSDVCVYFGVVFGLAALGLLATQFPGLRKFFHRRATGLFGVRKPGSMPKWMTYVQLYPTGATVGELCAVGSFIGLFFYWLYFWGFDYGRIRQESVNMNDPHVDWQVAARVLGHLTTLCMSFMVYPITRNSVWESAFGIPFDRAIKYHRVLGRITWLLVTLHMVVWQIKWAMEGTLWNNVVSIDNLLIAPFDNSNACHDDNFTIPIAELSWLVLTAVLIVANFWRRTHYALFQYTHHAVWFFFFAALLHSWTHWYYMIGGLSLYILDKVTRLVKASRQVTVLRLSHAVGVTRLEVSADFLLGGQGYFAGQYAFVNIPAISAGQWHPFSISSSPQAVNGLHGERLLTFHIQNAGPGTWTEKLAGLAAATLKPSSLSISIDGPYGRAGHYFEHKTLLLVAGGIGITPIHSVITDLHLRASQPQVYGSVGSLTKVHLVWVVRDAPTFQLFADTFASILRDNPGGMFQLHLHCTNSSKPVPKAAPLVAKSEAGIRLLTTEGDSLLGTSEVLPAEVGMCNPANALFLANHINYGRPDLDGLFSRVSKENAAGEDVCTMVCGPQPLIGTASWLAQKHDFSFHTEIFHF